MTMPKHSALPERARAIALALGVDLRALAGEGVRARTPITGETLAELRAHTAAEAAAAVEAAHRAFLDWRPVPAPRRGEVVRAFGERLRAHKDELGEMVSIETGKVLSEGRGEVQEIIDICDFAVGLSRQLHGLTIATERPGHRMMETWHPLGVCGVITAFNFPAAVWGWNAALAFVCGDAVVWKPSEKATLTALACHALWKRTLAAFPDLPQGIGEIVIGDAAAAAALVDGPRVPLVSATGSTRMGAAVAPRVAARFGRAILELGGNNAAIVAPSADLDLAVRAIAFSAVGTAGQRCTSLRRLIVHESIRDDLVARLKRAYASLTIGNPLDAGVLVGPLIDRAAFDAMQAALAAARAEGAVVSGGARREMPGAPDAWYAEPAICEAAVQGDVARRETFAPILHVVPWRDLGEAIAIQNDVPQGLASSIFTRDLGEAELFLSAVGSDCGIANVNIGPSGAEIGGAFGGEKQTGGGRESGSDAWKAYMRRATNTVNYSRDLPLAQGVTFDIG
ncbi:MAG: aldehyde dehydrogenase family protein [Betaproteobacteria bacterium]|nr:aldehyde dehydrogenase family protein [Betaproteobacteria bacterium]